MANKILFGVLLAVLAVTLQVVAASEGGAEVDESMPLPVSKEIAEANKIAGPAVHEADILGMAPSERGYYKRRCYYYKYWCKYCYRYRCYYSKKFRKYYCFKKCRRYRCYKYYCYRRKHRRY